MFILLSRCVTFYSSEHIIQFHTETPVFQPLRLYMVMWERNVLHSETSKTSWEESIQYSGHYRHSTKRQVEKVNANCMHMLIIIIFIIIMHKIFNNQRHFPQRIPTYHKAEFPFTYHVECVHTERCHAICKVRFLASYSDMLHLHLCV